MSTRHGIDPSGWKVEPLRFTAVITPRRRNAGFAVALLGVPLLAWLFSSIHSPELLAVEMLGFQLLVVVIALIGGMWPAVLAAVLSALALDLLFIEPHLTIAVADPVHAFILLLHIVIAVLVSFVVGRSEQQTQKARRAAADADLLQAVAGSVLHGQDAIQALLERTREAFVLPYACLKADEDIIAASGEPVPDQPRYEFPVDRFATLEIQGPEPTPSAMRLIRVITAQLAAVLEHRRLEEVARELEPLATSDRVRGALLSALSHDLRRPLASATAAVGGLRAAGDTLSISDERELLETAEESLETLTALVTDLLDVSRVQSGILSLSLSPIDPMDVILPALDEFDSETVRVDLAADHGPAQLLADPVLLQRALANLLANAIRFSPEGTAVRLSTRLDTDRIEILVIDHGPGIPDERMGEVFVPFQRLGDTDNTTGLGLGLALARGFVEAMHGTLEARSTPGGGLTMAISLPKAARNPDGEER